MVLKVAVSNPDWDNLKTLSVDPAVSGHLFEPGNDKAVKEKNWARGYKIFFMLNSIENKI